MIKRFSQILSKDVTTCGGKGASLGEMTQSHFPVPNGFVLTTKAFGLDPHQRDDEVLHAFDELNCKFVAVRSSGTKEDGIDDSFAGQFDTYLFVTKEKLIEQIIECHNSVNSERIISYCESKNINRDEIKVAVVIQKMINSDVAGVCFTVNPVSGNTDEIMIEAGYGVGEAVVSGMITPDNYIVHKISGEITKNVSEQTKKLVLDINKGGTREELVESTIANIQKLSDKHISELAELTKNIEKHYGKPMDTEWAVEDGKLYMLQARPVTNLIRQTRNITIKQKEIIDEFLKRKNWYEKKKPDVILDVNYPGKPFYLSFSYFFDTDLYEEWGDKYNIFCNHISLGKMHFYMPIYVFALNEFDKIKKEGINHLKEKIAKAKCEIENWSKLKIIGNSLKEYCKIIGDSFSLLRKINTLVNISTNFDLQISKELEKVGFSKDDVLKYGVDKEHGATTVYNKEIEETIQWFQDKKIDLTHDYEKLIQNEAIKSKLMGCYEKGYFLHSSYAGVTLRSLQKEFDYIRGYKISNKQEEIENKERNKEQKKRLEIAQFFSYFRDFRKEIQQKIFYLQAEVLEKIATIIGIHRDDLEYLQPNEIDIGFFSNIGNMKKVIESRKIGSIYLVTNKGNFFLDGHLANDIHNKIFLKDKNESVSEITGNIAYKGTYTGKVRIIFDTHKENNFTDGDVLVTGMTSPNFVLLMKKSGAIITDAGGVTCHAAIIARELQKPCIIGTKTATKILKDGDIVEVDADNGVIRIITK